MTKIEVFLNTDTWLVTHTFENTKCPFRHFIPGGFGCNLLDADVACTGRNCPALTPGGDTIDLGTPCAKCGATDGWICECRFKKEWEANVAENDRVYRLEQFIKWHGGWEALFYVLTQEERKQLFERLQERIEEWEREET